MNATMIDIVDSVLQSNHNPISIFKEIIQRYLDHETWGTEARAWVIQLAREQYGSQLGVLASKSSGWHFSALKAKACKIEDLEVETMLRGMQQIAPDLCSLISELMSADKKLDTRRIELAATREKRAAELKTKRDTAKAAHNARAADLEDNDEVMYWQSVGDVPDLEHEERDEEEELWAQFGSLEDDEDTYWRQEFEPHMPEDPSDEASAHDVDHARERRNSLLKIVRTMIISNVG